MDQQTLAKIEARFIDYAGSFFGNDKFINFNLHFKLCHSLKVRRESLYIASGIGMGNENISLAQAIALLHDVGRFPQFVKFKTYKDTISVNHGILGADEIIRTKIIDDIVEPSERRIILDAVKYHGDREIPDTLAGNAKTHMQIIRDADKIDIYRVAIMGYAMYRKDPENFPRDLEYPENGKYSKEVIDAVYKKEKIHYNLLKTMDDARLLQIGWVFDINFKPSLHRILKNHYIQALLKFMPDDQEIRDVGNFIIEHIKMRLNT